MLVRRSWVWPLLAIAVLLAAKLAVGQQPYRYGPNGEGAPGGRAVLKSYAAVCHIANGNVHGSGTLVAVSGRWGLVLSCRHVNPRQGAGVTLSWPVAGQRTQGTVWGVVPGNGFDTDLAVIVCERPRGIRPVKVAKFDPRRGPFVGVGWRDGWLRVSHPRPAQLKGGGLISVPAPFVGGQSGGALFNRDGHLVGVVVASDRRAVGISADGPQLHSFINQFRR